MKALTPEKLARMNRYLNQKEKAIRQLHTANCLYDFIDAVRYAYGLSVRYRSTTLSGLIKEANVNNDFLHKCIIGNILVPFNGLFTPMHISKQQIGRGDYFFNKANTKSLQEYITEQSN